MQRKLQEWRSNSCGRYEESVAIAPYMIQGHPTDRFGVRKAYNCASDIRLGKCHLELSKYGKIDPFSER